MSQASLSNDISFSGNGINVREDKGSVILEPFKSNCDVFLVRSEGPLVINATNDKLIINYGGEYILDIASSEYSGHIVSLLNDQKIPVYTIEGVQYEDGIEQKFDIAKIIFDDEGHKLIIFIKDESVDLEVSLQVEGFDEKRKLKYSEFDGRDTFSLEMKSRSEMNLEEINKVEQELLESNRAGMRSATMGIARSAVAGAITRSFDVFREHGLQVLRNGVPVVEL